jgi:hypothetical protein
MEPIQTITISSYYFSVQILTIRQKIAFHLIHFFGKKIFAVYIIFQYCSETVHFDRDDVVNFCIFNY